MKYLLSLFLVLGLLSCDPKDKKKEEATPATPEVEVEAEVQEATEVVTDTQSVELEVESTTVSSTTEDIEE